MFRGVIVCMGVSGTGKTEVALRLADRLGSAYVEADRLHSPGNIGKMARGEGLTDADRWPWLTAVAEATLAEPARPVVVACSALRRSYRDFLHDRLGLVRFVFLNGPPGVIQQRLDLRPDHFAKAALLESQLATLERPDSNEDVIFADIRESPSVIVEAAIATLD